MVSSSYPRIVLAAPNSSSGKTTVSIGLMAALHARGLAVAPFKIGPDYIDPGYHALATGVPGRNLDAWLCGTERIAPLFAHGAGAADISVVEGVMGLYDGRLGVTEGRKGFGSTAHVAELIDSPVILVMDASGVSRTLAANAFGLANHPQAPKVGGVILNKTGSQRAVEELKDAFAEVGLPVIGAIPRKRDLVVASRHLGLVPAAERDQAREVVEATGRLIAENVDLDEVIRIAQTASSLSVQPWSPGAEMRAVDAHPMIGIAAGRAFTFRYAESTELLRAAGCEVVEFDPMSDPHLPKGIHGLYLGGGFPEVYAEELAANRQLLAEVQAAVKAGLPTVAECAGLLYLCRRLDGVDMTGALPVDAQMSPRLTMGYRELAAASDSVVTRTGERIHSHEFHRTTTTVLDEGDSALSLAAAWTLNAPTKKCEGVASDTVLASYQHIHWSGYPQLAQRFADACADFARHPATWRTEMAARACSQPDLRYHGDAQLRAGAVNLAVNVQPAPAWLIDEVANGQSKWGEYPDSQTAKRHMGAKYALELDQFLITAGAAAAFRLMATAFPQRKVVVVHPQFTEPERAWRAAGHQVRRLVLRQDEGFRLDASRIPANTDVIVIGNPTNPTGVLHPLSEIRKLVRPGALVVIDEAFMDFADSESESALSGDLDGLLITRSFTKMWGIPGLRAGFVAGDRALIAQLAEVQEPWPVSVPALDAIVAVSGERGARRSREIVDRICEERSWFVDLLAEAGFAVAGDPRTPFVLIDVRDIAVPSPWQAIADEGFAVRRCDTFPGLGPEWIRVSIANHEVSAALVEALVRLRDSRI